jgi:hypothetical protein
MNRLELSIRLFGRKWLPSSRFTDYMLTGLVIQSVLLLLDQLTCNLTTKLTELLDQLTCNLTTKLTELLSFVVRLHVNWSSNSVSFVVRLHVNWSSNSVSFEVSNCIVILKCSDLYVSNILVLYI